MFSIFLNIDDKINLLKFQLQLANSSQKRERGSSPRKQLNIPHIIRSLGSTLQKVLTSITLLNILCIKLPESSGPPTATG